MRPRPGKQFDVWDDLDSQAVQEWKVGSAWHRIKIRLNYRGMNSHRGLGYVNFQH